MNKLEQSKVSIAKVDEDENLDEYLYKLLETIKLKTKIEEDSRVIIKPNLNSLNGPNTGVTTDVRIVDSLIRILTESYSPSKIEIVESDSFYRLACEAFEALGYAYLPKRHRNVKLVNLSATKSITVREPLRTRLRTLRLSHVFLGSNYFITMPKLRTMPPTIISCALKNQFGCLSERFKGKYHPYLDTVIANLNTLLRPDLCVVDGIVGKDSRGPKRVGVLMMSNDPVACDTVAAKIMGFNPQKIRHITLSKDVGIGSMDRIEIETHPKAEGNNLSIFRQQFYVEGPLNFLVRGFGYWCLRRINDLKYTYYLGQRAKANHRKAISFLSKKIGIHK